MFELKPLSNDAIPEALAKAERYRLLNEPWHAESICLDILHVQPLHQQALATLLLSLTDQFSGGVMDARARALAVLPLLSSDYQQAYHAGIICERWAEALLVKGSPGAGFAAYDSLREAMEHYQRAEPLRPPGNDDAVLRWNTCARILNRNQEVRPRGQEEFEPALDD